MLKSAKAIEPRTISIIEAEQVLKALFESNGWKVVKTKPKRKKGK